MIKLISTNILIVITSCALYSTAETAGRIEGFPVRIVGKVNQSSPVVGDIDGDQKPEIVMVAGNTISVINHDGTALPGFPIQMKGVKTGTQGILASPALGDIDGDGKKDIVVVTPDGMVAAITSTPGQVIGFPVKAPSGFSVSPTLTDLDGDGKLEIIAPCDNGKIYAYHNDGKPVRNFPLSASGVLTGVAVGDIDGDGKPDLVVGSSDGYVQAWNADGKPKSGFPFRAKFTITGEPVIGDIDDDGKNDVVFGSHDYHLYAVKGDGMLVKGFPFRSGYRIYSAPALGDMNGDGVVEIAFISANRRLNVITRHGKRLRGFPVSIKRRTRTSPVIGDIDGDGNQDIVVAAAGRLFAFSRRGRLLDGFPKYLGAMPESSPVLVDLGGDGVVDVISIVGKDGAKIHAHSSNKRKAPVKVIPAWPMHQHDCTRLGRYFPNDPRYKQLIIEPLKPTTDKFLSCKYTYFDLDGDPERGTKIRWYRNRRHIKEFDDNRRVPPTATRRGEKWHYTLQGGEDFSRWGKGKRARIFRSSKVTIHNSYPSMPIIAIEPQNPKTKSHLIAKIIRPATDLNGDRIRYRYTWLSNRRSRIGGWRANRVNFWKTRKGDRWTVIVLPHDRHGPGMPAHAEVVIGNTPPGAPRIALSHKAPRTDTPLSVRILKNASDADQDKVIYQYSWYLNNKIRNFPPDMSVLPPGTTKKGQNWKVVVTSHDGDDRGASAELQTKIDNTPPNPPQITIEPVEPRTDRPLKAVIVKEGNDLDNDPLTYRIRWYRNNRQIQSLADKAIVPARMLKRGDSWKVEVIPFDGEVLGKSAWARSAGVKNSAPTPPGLTLEPLFPQAGRGVLVKVLQPAIDHDGDEVTLRYQWLLNGKAAAFPITKNSLNVSEVRKGQNWQVVVVPFDKYSEGRPAIVKFTVGNTLPSRPQIALPKAPSARKDLHCQLLRPSSDVDGDPIVLRYRWYVNGALARKYISDRIPSTQLKRDDVWLVRVTPFDGSDIGQSATAQVRIVNLPPSLPKVRISPKNPKIGELITCSHGGPAKDADGDNLTYRIQWYAGKTRLNYADNRSTIRISPVGSARRCVVVANDGMVDGPSGWDEVKIANSPPTSPQVSIRPLLPVVSDNLTCHIQVESKDIDGDPVNYRYRWFRNGKLMSLLTGSVVPASATNNKDKWDCSVVPGDGKSHGLPGKAGIIIQNSPPSSPLIRLVPKSPSENDELHCEIVKKSVDPDGDNLQYHFTWYKNGRRQNFSHSSQRVPARLITLRDFWQCEVAVSDGRKRSKAIRSLPVIVK